MARRTGKLLKGGIPDTKAVAKMVLNDWQRGKIPYFVRPEGMEDRVKDADKSSTEAPEQPTEVSAEEKLSTDDPSTADAVATSTSEAADQDPNKPEDPNKIPTALELEKNLEPIQQNFGEVKIGF